MYNKRFLATLAAGAFILGCVAAPTTSAAQQWRNRAIHHRQQTKNTWRNIAIASGAIGIYGLLRHDNTLFFAGTAGALYSASRYEHDRRSQSRMERARAAYFSRPYFYRNGKRYRRRVVWRHGHKYFQFARG